MGFWDALDAFGSWLGDHLKAILDLVGKVLEALVVSFRSLVSVLGAVFSGHFQIFTKAALWVGHAMSTLVKKWIPEIIQEIRGLYGKLRHLMQPIVDTIRKIRAIQQAYFNQYIRPILNFIQHLRQFLVILRLLHVKFATQLDQRLADLEGKLTAQFMLVLRSLNTVSDYLNYILDPFGLVDSGLYLQTALRSIGALFNALHDVQRGIIGGEDDAKNKLDQGRYNKSAAQASVQQRAQSGSTPDDLAQRDAVRSAFKEMGYTF